MQCRAPVRDIAFDGAGRRMRVAFDGNDDVFLVHYAANGNAAWAKRFGDGTTQLARGLAIDGAGRVTIGGEMAGNVDFGGGPLASEGSGDVFLLKLAPSGTHVWSQRFGDFQDQSGLGVAGSATGRVGVTGTFRGGINLGDGPKNAQGTADLFVGVFGP